MNLDGLLQRIRSEAQPMAGLNQRALTANAAAPRSVVLPEPADHRVLLAAAAMIITKLARPLLLGNPHAAGFDQQLMSIVTEEYWLDPGVESLRQEVAAHLLRRRRQRGMTQGQSHVLAMQPLHQSVALLAQGKVDALVAGATCATAEVVRAALWGLGPDRRGGLVSSAFLMLSPDSSGTARNLHSLVMADCAVVPHPDRGQLVQIGAAAGREYQRLFGKDPAVAFLSYSTLGSARHPAVQEVASAARALATEQTSWRVRGEVQVDAALVPDIAQSKGLDWGPGGTADVLVFPDLASGNIGHKLVERLGGWRAVGPLLLGLKRPVCDLSRGCTPLDIYQAAILVTLP